MPDSTPIAVVIDEEPHFSEIMASALRIAGFDVVQCFDATSAWNIICSQPEKYGNALLFIDMALEPGEDEALFSHEASDNFMTTGLVLAACMLREKIISEEKRVNMILYSAHQQGQAWTKINEFCQKYGTRKWQKRADADLDEIFELAEGYVG